MKKENVFVEITNDGEIDSLSLSLVGASTKRADNSKIGFFGSGNKYALALLLRENIDFKIFSGTRQIKIEKEEVMFRGQLYEQIIIDGNKTSLTTDMGVDWEEWFAIRELYCNAIDEGGHSLKVANIPKGVKGKTKIYVSLTTKLSDFFKNINQYILTNYEAIDNKKTHYGNVELLESDGIKFNCYRKNIRIYPENTVKSLYWYNFYKIEINESRTYKYEHEITERIASYFAKCEDKTIIENYLKNWKGNFEEKASWEYTGNDKLSPMWHNLLQGKRVYPENLALFSGDFEAKHNSYIVPANLAKKIHEQFPDVAVVGYGQNKYEILEMTENEKRIIDKAKEELELIGYKITSEIKVAESNTEDTIAWYDKKTDIIYHTRKYLTSIKELKNTLLEEHFHSIGHNDGQREFVTFLIDELIGAKER